MHRSAPAAPAERTGRLLWMTESQIVLFDPATNIVEEIPRMHIVAIVYAPAAARSKDFEFYEIRAHNFGYDHALFTDPQEAMAWLRGSDAQ